MLKVPCPVGRRLGLPLPDPRTTEEFAAVGAEVWTAPPVVLFVVMGNRLIGVVPVGANCEELRVGVPAVGPAIEVEVVQP